MNKIILPFLFKIEKTLGPLEQEVMNEIWQIKKTTVREVLQRLQKQKKFAYTTIMTVMDNLYKKGFLKREKIKKTYYYSPIFTLSKITDFSLRKIISDLFLSYGKLKIFLTFFLLLINFRLEFSPFYYGFFISFSLSFGIFFFFQFLESLNLSGIIDYFNFALSNIDIFTNRFSLFTQVFVESLPITELIISLIFLIISFNLSHKLKVFRKLTL